jgi:hypothetical protein
MLINIETEHGDTNGSCPQDACGFCGSILMSGLWGTSRERKAMKCVGSRKLYVA